MASSTTSRAPIFDKGGCSLLIDGCKWVAASAEIFGTAYSNSHWPDQDNFNIVRIAMANSKSPRAPIFDKGVGSLLIDG